MEPLPKSEWGPGPWQDEPDRLEWRCEGTPRLPCLIVRANVTGALCGYVGVPEGHPWHGAGYGLEADVHGGVTYGAPCDPDGHICHEPRTGEPAEVWWIGFDCCHLMDVAPATVAILARLDIAWPAMGETYKPVSYVRAEVESLARQAQRAAKGLPPGTP
jgi:hypothetical protein